MKSLIFFAALLIATPAFAGSPAPKPPNGATIRQLQEQVQILQKMVEAYRGRAVRAEDMLLQMSARQAVETEHHKTVKGH